MHKRTLLLSLAGFLLIATALVAAERRNDGDAWLGRPLRDPELSRIMSVVDRGWRTGLEAGLDRNRSQQARFEQELDRYYSTRTPVEVAAADARARGDEPAPTSSAQSLMAFDPLAPKGLADQNFSELAKQKAYIASGRQNEKSGSFKVLDFGVDSMKVVDYKIQNDGARVVVDITFWSQYLFDDGEHQVTSKPSGTQRHTFELRRENGAWKIVSDTFEIPAGSEP
jgi:hypothetical protein